MRSLAPLPSLRSLSLQQPCRLMVRLNVLSVGGGAAVVGVVVVQIVED